MFNLTRPPSVNESEFMAPKIVAERGITHLFPRMTLLVIGSLIISFLIWSSFSKIDVVTRGTGRVIPSQKDQIIANLEGGIIKEILVKEGDVVQKGQILMRIDPTIFSTQYKTSREQYLRYLASKARLDAQLTGKDYQVLEEIKTEYPSIAVEEMKHYSDRIQHLQTQIGIAQQIVIQKKQDIAQGEAKNKQAAEQLKLSEQELKMVGPLVNEQLISKREILRLQRDAENLKGEVASGKASHKKNQAAYEQAQFELQQVPMRLKNEDEEQLRDITIKLADARRGMLEAQDRMTRTEVRSPIKGIVKEIKSKTIGGVIKGADEIISVVPLEDNLLIEASVLPSDIAFVHVGQEATVKVVTYDYSIYGSLKGKVMEISANTVHDPEQKRDFYRVLLKTHKNYLDYEGKQLPIIPGLTVEADILTGTRTVMQYLLKPIIKGTTSALKER